LKNARLQNLVNVIYQKVKGESGEVGLPVPLMDRRNVGHFLYQQRLFKLINDLDGDIVECGVGHGKSMLSWAYLSIDENRNRKIWGFDSFEGFPEPVEQDSSPRNPGKGEWGGTSLPDMLNMLSNAGLEKFWIASQLTLVKGFFEDSLVKYTGEKIALLHLDVDLYSSYQIALESFYSKVAIGGIIAFDEYMGTKEHYKFPGAKKAIDEFFAGHKVNLLRDPIWGKYYLIKNEEI